MGRSFGVDLVHPRAGTDDGLSERDHVMAVVHILCAEAPCDDRIRTDLKPFLSHVFEEREPAFLGWNDWMCLSGESPFCQTMALPSRSLSTEKRRMRFHL
jgi:hypothetical protein